MFFPVEIVTQWLGGLLACAVLGAILYGIWRGFKHQTGRAIGPTSKWLRSAWFYFASVTLFFGLSYLGWIPLPLSISPEIGALMLALGSLLYFLGLLLVLWARLTLGGNYFVSTGLGAQLFADHHLVTHGPFARVRHPMYVGLILAALGGLLLYHTWTTLYFACFAPLLMARARREEQALAAEFGAQWQEYCKHVPAFVPRPKRRDI